MTPYIEDFHPDSVVYCFQAGQEIHNLAILLFFASVIHVYTPPLGMRKVVPSSLLILRRVIKRIADGMAYASSPTLLFLLLPLLSHAYQTCPDQVGYRCPDFKGTSVMFPFTNTSLRDCGFCVLECKNHTNTTFQSGQQQLSYNTKQIFPDNNTVVLEYPGLHKLISNVCSVQQSDSPILPTPPLTTFTILNQMVFYRCRLDNTDPPPAQKTPYTNCGDGNKVYGPYAADRPPKGIPTDCREIMLPNSTNDDFSMVYHLPDECSLCAHDISRCHDHNTGKHKCPATGKGKKNRTIILISVVPGCLMIIIALLFLYWRKRKIKQGSSALTLGIISFKGTKSNLVKATMNGVTVFSYNELKEATNNFDSKRELGEGGFGVVYYGKLRDGRDVAVKRLYEKNYRRIQQFKNEIKILTDLRHKNLVTLYGCTSHHSQELLLVYEYIPNGTVADHLHGEHPKSEFLPWSTRMNIAIETAEALSYLHYKDIIHRDVKTNNILLDSNFSVKVADFGLSRLFPADVTHVSTAPQGTPGYLDPEYHQCYHLTDKSDVYSFGVVLIELISSLPAVDVGRHKHEINLSTYAVKRIQFCSFNELVDPKLGFETDSEVRRMTTLVAELAFRCLQQERELRPSIDEVLHALQGITSFDYEAPDKEETGFRVEKTEAMKSLHSSKNSDDIGSVKSAQPPPSSPESAVENRLSQSMKRLPSLKDNEGLKILAISKGQSRTYSHKENDDVGLLRNAQPLPTSPDSVMDTWCSKFSTPNTSSSDSAFS